MPDALTLLLAGTLAFVAAAIAVVPCRLAARRLGIVARPVADRWHRETIPLLGGLALAAGVAAVAVGWRLQDAGVWTLLAGSAAMLLVGLADDVRPLKPQTKLTAQLVVASLSVAAGLRFELTGVQAIDIVASLVWLVGLTNAFNLLDNMDGLAAGTAAIAGLVCTTLLAAQGAPAAALVGAALAGASLGFLLYNFNPASIFMGDAGSHFVGFLVAGLGLVGAGADSPGAMSALLFPVMVALVPIFDTALVALSRVVAGRPISQGGRDHTSHRLVATGLTDRQAVLLLYAAAALSGVIAIYTARFGLAESVVAVVLFGIGVGMLGLFLGRIRAYPEAAEAPPHAAWLTPLIDFSYRRQAGAFALDLLLVVLAYYAAYRLRFEGTFAREEPLFTRSLPIVIACKMLAFAVLRTYQGLWRYTSLRDLIRLAQAVSLGSVLAVITILFVYRFREYSRALFVLDWILLLLFVGGSRVSVRVLAEWLRPRPSDRRPVLIYGAGDGGVMVLREIRNNAGLGREPVGFVDDDGSKHRTEIQGLRVVGGLDRLGEVLRATPVAEVVVSSSRIPEARVARLRAICEAEGVLVVRSVLRLE